MVAIGANYSGTDNPGSAVVYRYVPKLRCASREPDCRTCSDATTCTACAPGFALEGGDCTAD